MKIKPLDNRGGVLVQMSATETQLPSATNVTATPETPVFRLREILVPVDFTECTEKALFYALPFARQFGATVTLLHVLEQAFVPATEFGMVVDVDVSKDAIRELEKIRTRVAKQVKCRIMMRQGGVEYEIVNAAKELDCDLIILGTHGRTGMDRLLLGSTVEKVVRRAGCPLFVVRPHEHDFISGAPEDWQGDESYLTSEIEAEMKAGV
ncbi:MAG: universal stress protein [Verrucomicrobiota bacterium]